MQYLRRQSYFIPLILFFLLGLWMLSGFFQDKKPASSTLSSQLVKVQVMDSTARLEEVSLTFQGHTAADQLVNIKSETSGQVIKVHVQKGQKVIKGQCLFTLNPEDRHARLLQEQALFRQRTLEYKTACRLQEKKFIALNRVAAIKADLDESAAKVKTITYELAHTKIVAPFAGILDRTDVDIGDYVTAGSQMGVVVSLNPITLVFSLPEKDFYKISVGQKAKVTINKGQGVGRVSYKAAVADDTTRTFGVEVTMANSENLYPHGSTAEICVVYDKVLLHHLSPAFLSLNSEGKMGVKILSPTNHVIFKPVTIVSSKEEEIWVQGLPEKVTLITVGHEFVEENQQVNPQRVSP